MLILTQLVKGIGDLKPVPRREQVEVEDIFAVGLIVKTIKDGLVVSRVVNGG